MDDKQMNPQPTLFDRPIVKPEHHPELVPFEVAIRNRVHRYDPATSYEAAENFIKSGKLVKHHKFILWLLEKYDREEGWTAGELARKAAAIMPVNENAIYYIISRRINEIEDRMDLVLTRKCLIRGSAMRAWRIKK
jgi:hypothetical protein